MAEFAEVMVGVSGVYIFFSSGVLGCGGWGSWRFYVGLRYLSTLVPLFEICWLSMEQGVFSLFWPGPFL